MLNHKPGFIIHHAAVTNVTFLQMTHHCLRLGVYYEYFYQVSYRANKLVRRKIRNNYIKKSLEEEDLVQAQAQEQPLVSIVQERPITEAVVQEPIQEEKKRRGRKPKPIRLQMILTTP